MPRGGRARSGGSRSAADRSGGGERSSPYSGRPGQSEYSQTQTRAEAVANVANRMSNVGVPGGTPDVLKPAGLRIAEVVGGAMGDYLRKGIISRIQAGGKPISQNGLVIGVETDGQYFGRNRDTSSSGGEAVQTGGQAAQMGAAAPQPDQPAAATVRRSALVKQIEAENRRRRLAGMRMLGSRTLLSGGQVGSADTLGA